MIRFETIYEKFGTTITTIININNTMIYCTSCNQDYGFVYFHCLDCIIHTINKLKKLCILRGVELEKVLPMLQEMSSDQ